MASNSNTKEDNLHMASSSYIDPAQLDLEDRVVSINRVTKVVKGGRRLRLQQLQSLVTSMVTLASVPVRLKKSQKQSVRLLKTPRRT